MIGVKENCLNIMCVCDLNSVTQVYGMAAWTNPLHSDAFPGLRKMEAEVLNHFLCYSMLYFLN